MKKKTIVLGLTAGLFIAGSITSIESLAGEWKNNNIGWWYINNDGTYPSNIWQWIDGNHDGIEECYYFNADGYLLTNAITPDGYFVNENGAWSLNGNVQQRSVLSVVSDDMAYNNFPTAKYYPYFLDDNVYLSGWDLGGPEMNMPVKGYGYIETTKADVINHGNYFEITNQKLEAANQYDTEYGYHDYKLPNGNYTTSWSNYLWNDVHIVYNGSFYLAKDAIINTPVYDGGDLREGNCIGRVCVGVEEYFAMYNMMDIGWIKGFDEKGYITYIYISEGG